MKAQGAGVREIARRLGRAPSTISRELRRNAATRGGQARVPGVGRAVEGRAGRAAAQDGEAGRERPAARVRAGAAVGSGPPPGRDAGRGAGDGAVEGPEQAASRGPAVGDGVEPGADRATG